MIKKYKWVIICINLIALLVYINYSISEKELILSNGKLILLELAPKDPRSLMQGDYMSLRYSISRDFNSNSIPRRGYCVVTLNDSNIASAERFQEETTPLNDGEYLIEYTSPNRWNINIGAESYFFQEGSASKYEAAKYGGVQIDSEGNSLLVGLYDESLKKID